MKTLCTLPSTFLSYFFAILRMPSLLCWMNVLRLPHAAEHCESTYVAVDKLAKLLTNSASASVAQRNLRIIAKAGGAFKVAQALLENMKGSSADEMAAELHYMLISKMADAGFVR